MRKNYDEILVRPLGDIVHIMGTNGGDVAFHRHLDVAQAKAFLESCKCEPDIEKPLQWYAVAQRDPLVLQKLDR